MLNTHSFIEKAKLKHGNKYDYSKTDYLNNKAKLLINCNIHGEFKQTPHDHLSSGAGCPKCAGNYMDKNYFIEKATLKHGNKYDAQKREKYWLEYYKANNWEMFNISKTGSLGSASKIWNKKKLQMEVNKYNNRKDFKNYCKKGYYAASRRKILDELFKNHLNKGYTKIKKPD